MTSLPGPAAPAPVDDGDMPPVKARRGRPTATRRLLSTVWHTAQSPSAVSVAPREISPAANAARLRGWVDRWAEWRVALARRSWLPWAAPVEPFSRAPGARQLLVHVIRDTGFTRTRPLGGPFSPIYERQPRAKYPSPT
jgi:hypothetical protein